MSDNLIEQGWRDTAGANHGFCCEQCCAIFRAMYFAGAMNAMNVITGWDSRKGPLVLVVNAANIAALDRELTAAFRYNEIAGASSESSQLGTVHH